MQIKITSPKTKDYNCIAWAASEDFRFWWPDSMMISYWPEGVEREETLSAFRKAYATKGFQVCADERFEDGYEKIAVYIDGLGKPQHAARQLIGEVWSSKLGEEYDIIHPFIHEWGIVLLNQSLLDLSFYGKLALILRRSIEVSAPKLPMWFKQK